MLSKPELIQPITVENWTRREQLAEPAQAMKPVRKKMETEQVYQESKGEIKDTSDDVQEDQLGDPREVVEQIQTFLRNLNIQLHFEIDKETGEFVVQVRNSETGEIIRQIPPEELLKLMGKLEELRGILFNKKI